jgi:hypothetical protein
MDTARSRKMPTVLVAALALAIAFSVVTLIMQLVHSEPPSYEHVDKWRLAKSGQWFMTTIMFAFGCRELSDRIVGRAARATRVAGRLFGVDIALQLVWMIVFTFRLGPQEEWFYSLESYTFWGISSAISVALFVAAVGRTRGLAIGGLVVCLIARSPQFLRAPVFAGLHLELRGLTIAWEIQSLIHVAGLAMLLVAIAPDEAARRPSIAAKGFSDVANGLWLRVIAAVVGALFTLFAIGMKGESGYQLVKVVTFGGLAINLISFAMVGAGAFGVARSAVDGVSQYATIACGAASLWCAGVMFDQVPKYYQVLYGDHGGIRGSEEIQALSVAMPLVATLAGAVFATAIAMYARTRGNQDLAARANGAGVGYLLLMLASIGLQSQLLEQARSQGDAIVVLFAAAGCGLVAQMLLSKVCRRASEAIAADPELPTARISEPT